MFIAHGREIKFFATQQAMPLVQEGVAKGISEEKKQLLMMKLSTYKVLFYLYYFSTMI